MKNKNRISTAFANDNFGIVSIDWSTKPDATIVFKLIADDGLEVFNHKVSLGDLR